MAHRAKQPHRWHFGKTVPSKAEQQIMATATALPKKPPPETDGAADSTAVQPNTRRESMDMD